MTEKEIDSFAFGLNTPMNFSSSSLPQLETMPSLGNAPVNFDLRNQGISSPVRDQQNCGSCYAFAATCLIEQYMRMRGQQAIDISEQDAVDCSIQRYRDPVAGVQNQGCQGGWPTPTLQYYTQTHLMHEQSYPYTSGQTNQPNRQCYKSGQVAISYTIRHVRANEDQIAQLLVTKGCLLIGIAADNEHKQNMITLRDGIYDKPGSEKLNPNHALCIIGYGVENGKPYWTLQNSWGRTWGVQGYGKIARGKNTCNILSGGVWYLE